MTTYEYDGDRLIRAVTVREPEFPADMVALLLGSRRLEDVARNRFGTPLAESMDSGNQFAYRGRKAPMVDWQEKAVEDEKDAYYKANPEANRNGHRWGPTS